MPDTTAEPILYTQTDCAESAKVRSWLTARGVSYTERDASADLVAAEALMATGTFATPLLVFGRTTVLGFRPDALRAVLSSQPGGRGPPVVSESREIGV